MNAGATYASFSVAAPDEPAAIVIKLAIEFPDGSCGASGLVNRSQNLSRPKPELNYRTRVIFRFKYDAAIVTALHYPGRQESPGSNRSWDQIHLGVQVWIKI